MLSSIQNQYIKLTVHGNVALHTAPRPRPRQRRPAMSRKGSEPPSRVHSSTFRERSAASPTAAPAAASSRRPLRLVLSSRELPRCPSSPVSGTASSHERCSGPVSPSAAWCCERSAPTAPQHAEQRHPANAAPTLPSRARPRPRRPANAGCAQLHSSLRPRKRPDDAVDASSSLEMLEWLSWLSRPCKRSVVNAAPRKAKTTREPNPRRGFQKK